MPEFLNKLSSGPESEICSSLILCGSIFFGVLLGSDSDEVHYLQSQNGNMHSSYDSFASEDTAPKASEFEALKCDVPADVPWCGEAFGE